MTSRSILIKCLRPGSRNLREIFGWDFASKTRLIVRHKSVENETREINITRYITRYFRFLAWYSRPAGEIPKYRAIFFEQLRNRVRNFGQKFYHPINLKTREKCRDIAISDDIFQKRVIFSNIARYFKISSDKKSREIFFNKGKNIVV